MTNSEKRELERTQRQIAEILRRVDSLPVLDSHTADEVLAYDEHGLPEPAANRRADKQMHPLPKP